MVELTPLPANSIKEVKVAAVPSSPVDVVDLEVLELAHSTADCAAMVGCEGF